MDATNRPPAELPRPTPAEREDLLLGSPLGRQFLSGFVDIALESTLFDSLGLGDVPGTATFSVGVGGRPWRVWRAKRREWDEVPADEVRAAVRAAVSLGQWRRLGGLTEAELLNELASVSTSFGFGGGDVALWGLTGVAAEELRPVAAALARSPAASGWWEPVRRADQRRLTWTGAGTGLSGIEDMVRRAMARERAAHREGMARRRPAPGERNLGALWWSAPGFAENTWTTGARAGLPTIELGHFIDTFMPFGEATAVVGSLTVDERARVAEIRRPEDWRALVARFPREVTGPHDGEWRTWGDVDGPWYLPDWEALAGHFDGVHVTIGGCLAACGLVQPVRDGYTVLAGWVPDATVWVRDVATASRRLGHWHGDPQSVGDWDDVLAGWLPDDPAAPPRSPR
ncbi:hypothetical protein [Streptomyces specialis]|uniref:hypothetical protein n=1 Tax=Streptomyces specialis TaxID=498367 RepID=UPI00073E5295|nr:hypothetical protein [Streptomyces specialis]